MNPNLRLQAILLFFGFFGSTAAFADLDFSSYPAKESVSECKKADFSTYSRARNAEEMIRKNNPDLSKPNFGGQYLLVQIPYMMGTDWLILDCKSGVFFKEVLTGSAEFKADSFLLRMTEKSSSDWKLWTGSTFIKAEETKSASPGPLDSSLPSRYSDAFAEHPASPLTVSCAPLRYSSYFKAQNAEMHLRNKKMDLSRPNFGGAFLLLKVELLFETIFLIANCETGVFYPESLSGELTFRADSSIAILTKTGKAPELYLWRAPVWIKRPDPTLSNGSWVFNEIHREEARSLIRLLPNPEHRSKIEFEDLLCQEGARPECSFRAAGAKETDPRISLNEAPGADLLALLTRYGRKTRLEPAGGTRIQVNLGHCIPEKSSCRLGVK